MRKILYIALFLLVILVNRSSSADETRHKWIGVQADVGAPDGVALGVVVRPVNWLRLTVAGTHNVMAPGIRGGFTLDPINFPIAPTLTLEGGHAFEGKVPGANSLPSFDYDYVNLHLGLEFGRRNRWRFFLQGGPSWIHASTFDFQSVVDANPALRIGNPSANVSAVPTGKLGFTVYF
jgi:hypothetical protein